MKRFIHINSHTIRHNRKSGERKPPIAVRRGRCGKAEYVDRLDLGPGARLVYDPEHPLKCGSVLWIELDC